VDRNPHSMDLHLSLSGEAFPYNSLWSI